MRVDDEMVERAAIAAWCYDGDSAKSWHHAEDYIKARRLQEARAALGSVDVPAITREARLVQYRCAAPSVMIASRFDPIGAWSDADLARRVEDIAHAMLAAERPADASARDEAALLKALCDELQKQRDIISKGIAAVRDILAQQTEECCDEAAKMLAELLPKEPMPGSLIDQVEAYLNAGNESTVEYIAERMRSNTADVLDALRGLLAKGKADIVSGSRLWAKVPR